MFDLITVCLFFIGTHSNVSSFTDASTEKTKSSSSILNEESVIISKDNQETCPLATPQIGEAELSQALVAAPLGSQSELSISKSGYDSSSPSDLQGRDSGISNSSLLLQDSHDFGIQHYNCSI